MFCYMGPYLDIAHTRDGDDVQSPREEPSERNLVVCRPGSARKTGFGPAHGVFGPRYLEDQAGTDRL
jgi:hypothetical protein